MGLLRNLRGSRISVRVYEVPQPAPAYPALPPPVPLTPLASGLPGAAPPPCGPDERVFGPAPWSAP